VVKTYQIPVPARGELRIERATVPFEYEPGEVVPADALEARVLEHLVGTGAAIVVEPEPKRGARKGA